MSMLTKKLPTSYDVYKLVSVPSLALALPRHTTSEDQVSWTSLYVCQASLGLCTATHDSDYPCLLPCQCSECSYIVCCVVTRGKG